jgi:hypothetical protein
LKFEIGIEICNLKFQIQKSARVCVHLRLLLLCCCLSTVGSAQTTAPAGGLESLSDDRLISELATRGLTNLLDRAFEVNQVPPAQRDGMRTLVALRQISDGKLTAAQRRDLIGKIAAGIEAALPSLTDPKTMMQQATVLLQYGVERDVNTLEYWGENPRTQAQVRPVVEAVSKLLDKTAVEAKKRADALANAIASPGDPKAKQWEQMADLATAADYTRHMADYYRALALDRASPERGRIAEEAIKFLAQYDNAESTVQAVVRLRMGKLHMTRGEFDQAKELFASIAANPPNNPIAPPPDAAQQWEARYFAAMCDLLARDPAAAQKQLDALVGWQQANLPKDKSTQDGAAAAAAMLQYRIHSLAAELATDEPTKAAHNAKAVAVLLDLVKKRADLQSIIFDQLLNRLPANADLKTLDGLLLQAFVARGDAERQRGDNERVDLVALQRGVDAVREILRRRKTDANAIDPQLADTDALLLGFFLLRLNRPPDGAEALLDYVQNFGADFNNATMALDNAMAIIGKLRNDPATADLDTTTHAYERFLPIAIKPPFSRKEFAYEYARRLQLAGKAKEAVEYFRQVPPNDKRLASARFFEMVALQQRLDDEQLKPEERAQIALELTKMMDDVRARLTTALATAATDQEKIQYRSMLVRTTLLAADAARREQNDPKRTLGLLENFEQVVRGLPNEKDLINNVLYTRVQAYMALGDSNSATTALVTLLRSKSGGEGAGIVTKVMQNLNRELDQARLAGDRARMQVLTRNRAQLSGFLVDWARNNADPNIKKFTYRYSVFDAATKQQAAELEDDPAARKAGLEAALKLYRQLESPESAELYRATLDPNSPDRNYPDPAVSLGIGIVAFDLGDYADAQKRLGQLLTDRKLGTPTMAVEENGQTRTIENDQYWEATLRLMKSNLALAADNPNDEQAQAAKTETINYLKQLYIKWGHDIGGKKWSGQFEQLRQQLIPDFNPDALPAATEPAATEPTTAP